MLASVSSGTVASASKTRAQSLPPIGANVKTTGLVRSERSSRVHKQKQQKGVVTQATAGGSEDVDFDKVLADLADKFEKSNNKAAIVGYSAAAVAALWFSEWLIHLPLLNFLLGFPIQLLGLALLPYFGVKYFVEKDSIKGDAGDAFNAVVKRLPGLEK